MKTKQKTNLSSLEIKRKLEENMSGNLYNSLYNKGITLIALVVTIVVLLILAGVSLNLVLGNNGIINKAMDAKKNTENATAREEKMINGGISSGGSWYDSIDEFLEKDSYVKFIQVSAGSSHSVVLDEDGNIWTWGYNGTEQLGDGTTTDSYIPKKIENLGAKFQSVSAHDHFNIALDMDGNIWSWGNNYYGQLGDGTNETRGVPKKIEGLGTTFKIVSGSNAIDIDGNIWTWGYNGKGQLGDGTTIHKNKPQKLTGLGTTFKYLSSGNNYTIAIDEEGNMWSWGYNIYGRLGLGNTSNQYTPKKITGLDVKFKKADAGEGNSIALDENGDVWTWGYNGRGQLGDGTTTHSYIPKKIENLGVKFTDVSVSVREFEGSNIAIDEEGNIWTWGQNPCGQLGNGTTESENIPKKLDELQAKFNQVYAYRGHTIALDQDGYVWTWGGNYHGQLGDGTNENKYSPYKIKCKK